MMLINVKMPTIVCTAPIAQLVERPLSEREVVGSNPGRTIPKV